MDHAAACLGVMGLGLEDALDFLNFFITDNIYIDFKSNT